MKSHRHRLCSTLEFVRVAPTIVALLGTMASSGMMAADLPETAAAVETLYRAHRFSSAPKLNPKTTFRIREFDVASLWPLLRVQLFEAEDMIDGETFAKRPFLCCRGVIYPFVESTGGHGLMSAVVHDNALYYSYSWGSGLHRSFVGRLTVEGGKPVRRESRALFHADMFVEADNGGHVRVVEGQWREFNRWEGRRALGLVDFGDPVRLKIVDGQGRDVLLLQ